MQRFLISDEDARTAARSERTVIRPNVQKLRDAGVHFLIGSDQFRKTPIGELFILARLGFSNRDVLRIALTDTARVIFPERKLGALADGYEASFLVLDGNPIDDLANIRKINTRIKQGVAIVP